MSQVASHEARSLGRQAALGHAPGRALLVIGWLLCGGVQIAWHKPRKSRRGCRLGRIRPLPPLGWERHGPGLRVGHESGRTSSQTLVRSLQPTSEAAPPRAGPKRQERPAENLSVGPRGQHSAGPYPPFPRRRWGHREKYAWRTIRRRPRVGHIDLAPAPSTLLVGPIL